jgi:photosystem II stability/assembly factor-like uncharacterized protein
MKKFLPFLFIALSLTLTVIVNSIIISKVEKKAEKAPNDYFFQQRAFPYSEINYEARNTAWEQSQKARSVTEERGEGWVLKGPFNAGGRISSLAWGSWTSTTIYAGAASGGIFKSYGIGLPWFPVFDSAMSLSVGDIAVAPSDTSVIWVGTGEANAGGGSMAYDGSGVYRSLDAGDSWQHLGLENTGSIGRIAVHPDNAQICYVAAMGRLFSNNPDRGVFRTFDGGATWEKVLFLNDSVGAIDIVIDQQNPSILYAALWERVRRPDRRNYGGPGCGIYRSYDGGNTWTLLMNGLPAPSAQVGRIGIDISGSDPNTLYAIYADNVGYFDGVYKTTNGGDLWFRTSDEELADCYASYGWWFGRITVDPLDPGIAYVIGFDIYKTTDGGNNWAWISSNVHVDQHDIYISPVLQGFLALGNDGGIYHSGDAGNTWYFDNNLPITQFYTCEIDEQHHERLYGGTQDNGTNRTLTGEADEWEPIYGGDGFYVLVDPLDNAYVYAEYQYGNFARSTNGGNSFMTAMSGISGSDRKNWNTPFAFDPNNPQTLYYGANRLYRTTNRALNWQVISPDLTNGSANSNVVYGTITTIAVAPSNSQFIYAGTDDGNVWRTSNGGGAWNNISSGLPLRWVTRVAADPHEAQTVYTTLSGYRYDNYLPHVFRSTDGGENWTDITGNLPDAPVNDIIIDPVLDSTLYIATDFGVHVTRDFGLYWEMLGDDLPNVPVVDLDFHPATRMLVAATYGRSMYSFDVDQLIVVNDDRQLAGRINIFPNPVDEVLNIKDCFAQENIEYLIVDMRGREILKGRLAGGNETHSIRVSILSPGQYLLRINSANNLYSKIFVKK